MAQKHITNFFKQIGTRDDSSTTEISEKKVKKEIINKDNGTDNSKRKLDTVKNNNIDEITEQNAKQMKYEEDPPHVDNVPTDSTVDSTKPKLVVKSEENGVQSKKIILPNSTKNTSGFDYDPAKHNYHPINDAFWKKGEPTPYMALCRTFQLIEEMRGRLKMIEILSNFFRSVIVLNPKELTQCVYLSLNQLAPAYEGVELGIAETSLMRAISKSTGQSLEHIKTQAEAIGDLGIVAEQVRNSQCLMFRPAPLTVKGVFEKLKDIATLSGHAAMNKKIEKIQSIFVACRYSEARFFIRSLLGKLRIGIAEQSLMQALALAITNTPPNQVEYNDKNLCSFKVMGEAKFKSMVEENTIHLKTAYCQCPNYDKVLPLLLEHGIYKLNERCPMEPGTPIKPMLAQPVKGVHEVLETFDNMLFTCEWKYDGERAQIHRDENGTISIYSRNQENNTTKYPDVISRIDGIKTDAVTSYIIDSEIVAWDTENNQILPFQVLSTRKRKNVDNESIRVQVCVYVFDLLYLNGKSLVSEPLIERRRLLKANFKEIAGQCQIAQSCDANNMDDIQQFLEESIKGNCEGLMVKTLEKDANYEIAKRSRKWLKLKKDYLAGVGDSLDLVVIGGYKGKGKRVGVYGGFLLACYDISNEEYQCICKIGTGFTDEDLKEHSETLKDHIIKSPKSYYQYDSSLEADVWFEPVKVWEVKCADLSLSPVHKAGIGIIDPEKGISLRFPRFIRIRDDKSPEDATTAEQVVDMYSSQSQIKNKQNQAVNDFEDDFY